MMDHAVYPDTRISDSDIVSDEARAEHVARICGAWDFGHVPTAETFGTFASWRPVFDAYPLLDSPAYHAFRSFYRWPPLPGGVLRRADYELADYLDGRTDPCVNDV